MDEPTVAFTKVSNAPIVTIKNVHIELLDKSDSVEDNTEE